MKKAISFMLFKLGAIPKRLRATLDLEGILVADEGMRGWIISKNVKGPGRRYIYRARGFSGCLVVTRKRILCFTYWQSQIDIAIDDPRISQIFVDIPREGRLTISFELSVFRDGWAGVIEFRFKTRKAHEFYAAMRSIGVQTGVFRKTTTSGT